MARSGLIRIQTLITAIIMVTIQLNKHRMNRLGWLQFL